MTELSDIPIAMYGTRPDKTMKDQQPQQQEQSTEGETSLEEDMCCSTQANDEFLENGEQVLSPPRDDAANRTQNHHQKRRSRVRSRSFLASAATAVTCGLAIACLNGSPSSSTRRYLEGVSSRRLRHDVPNHVSTAALPPEFPVVVRVSFSSVSEADDALLPLGLDVMGRGHRLLGGNIERHVLLHSEEDWSTLESVVSTSTTQSSQLIVDEDQTNLLHLDESTTYDAPPDMRRRLATYGTMPYRPCFRTVQGTIDTMYALAEKYPNMATVEPIGTSYLGDTILMLKITGPEATHSPIADREPMVITSGLHAREYAPVELVTRFAEHLTANYGVVADVTSILDHTVIYAVLQSNPDSRKIAERNLANDQPRKNQNSSDGCTRRGLYGVDLNRNFDFKWRGPGASSDPCHIIFHGRNTEKETLAIQNLSKRVFPTWQRKNEPELNPIQGYDDKAGGLYVDVHAFGRDIIFPYGYDDVPVGNIDAFKSMSHKICSINDHEPSGGGYFFLGKTSGDSLDYHYGRLGVASILFEIGDSWAESCFKFEDEIFPRNLDALTYTSKLAMTPYRTSMGPDIMDVQIQVSADGTEATIIADVSDSAMAALGNKPRLLSATQTIERVEAYLNSHPYDKSPSAPGLMMPVDGTFDSHSERVTIMVKTASLSGKQTICFRATDSDGYEGAVTCRYIDIVKPNVLPSDKDEGNEELLAEQQQQETTTSIVTEQVAQTLRSENCEDIVSPAICIASVECSWRGGNKDGCVGICQGKTNETLCLMNRNVCVWDTSRKSCFRK